MAGSMADDDTPNLHSRYKEKAFREMMERGTVMVHLDPQRPGVIVPSQFLTQQVLRLNFAYSFSIPGFHIDGERVSARLRFSGTRHECSIPWTAVFALTLPDDGHEGVVFADAIPSALQDYFESGGITEAVTHVRLEPRTEPVSPPTASQPRPNPFAVVEGEGQSTDGPARPRPNLRLVDDA